MKSALLFASAALSAATAPPRIELDLSAMTNAYQIATPIVRSHDLSYTQNDGTAVMSRQDWTEKCPAGTTTDHTNCPFPHAAAWDSKDQSVDVTTRVKLVDMDGQVMNKDVTAVNFAVRSTYLFRYDANDSAGNRAEQVIFALILDDTTAPVIRHDVSGVATNGPCGGAAETVEAASSWSLCRGTTAWDNIDGTVPVKYSISQVGGAQLCNDADIDIAETKITTNTVGRFLVTICANDNAGVYGVNSLNNNYCTSKAVRVVDTRPPVINVQGAEPTVHECATTYTDAGATVTDLLDTAALGGTITPTVTSDVNSGIVADYTVSYNAKDNADNDAVQQVRNVQVRDTTAPVVALAGDGHYQEVHYAGAALSDDGATCSDTCDTALGNSDVVTTWSRAFNTNVLGEYIATYTCTDASSNSASVERKFTVEDRTCPIIAIMGNEDQTIEATRDAEYTDSGATCSDTVDGVLSHAVEVSGQVVNQRIPGTYIIRYDCQDLSGNQATPMNRTVTIVDRVCPTITLLGNAQVQVEAGFPYTDAGATATDTLDGDITQSITTTYGATGAVDTSAAHNSQYVITYHVTDASGLSECAAAVRRTVTVVDTLPPVISLHLKKKLIHTSDGDSHVNSDGLGVGDESNPAERSPSHSTNPGSNPYLEASYQPTNVVANNFKVPGDAGYPTSHVAMMAEEAQTSSVNGWVIGAAASAVSGLALLVSSARKQTVTAVPV